MKKTLKIILGSLWFLVVAWFFFVKNHPYYLESFSYTGRVIAAIISFALAGGIMFGVEVLLNKILKRGIFEIRVSVAKIITFIVLTTLISLGVMQISNDIAIYRGGIIFRDAESWGLLPEGTEPTEDMEIVLADQTILTDSTRLIEGFPADLQSSFTSASAIKSMVFTGGQILLGLLAIFLLNIVAFSFGGKLLKIFHIGADSAEDKISGFVLNTAAGLTSIMIVVFVLGFFNMASFLAIAVALIAMLGFGAKEALAFLKLIIKESEPIKKIDLLSGFVICGGALIMAYNILGIIRPMPIGWDDSNYYLYIPEVFAHLKGLLDGVGGMYNWELINAIASYSDSAFLPMMVNFWGGILALTAIYLVAKLVLNKEQSLMSAAIFYAFPSVMFQSSMDLKNDMALLFFELAAFYALINWFKSDKSKWLALAGVLIGVSLGVKATAGIALIIMIAIVMLKIFGKYGSAGTILAEVGFLMFMFGDGNLYEIPVIATKIGGIGMILVGIAGVVFGFYKTQNKKSSFAKIGLFLATMFLSLSPWILKNTIIDKVPLETGYLASAPDLAEFDYTSYVDKCTTESSGGEFDIYISGLGSAKTEKSSLSLLKMPWQMTMNPGFNGVYIDISCIFLGLLPIIVWYLIERKEEKIFRIAMIWTAIYFMIMIFFFNGVPWYGFIGYTTFLILVLKILKTQEKDSWQNEKMLSVISKTAIVLTVAMGIFVRIGAAAGLDDLAYMGGLISKEEYIEAMNPGVTDAAIALSADTESVGTTIYKVGGATRYFLAGLGYNYAYDESLDAFACLDGRYVASDLVDIFKEMGVTYIAFDYTTLIDGEMEEEILTRYYNFLVFCQENLETVVSKEDFGLFKIPTE